MGNTILDYTSGPLLKTGQTTDFTPAGRTTKDDGGFRLGIPGSLADDQYLVLTTGNFSGTTAITVNGKTDTHTNECVFDKVTSLMWNRDISDSVFGVGTEDLFWSDVVTNEDVFDYCDNANIASLSGFTDWRIPNWAEMRTLVDTGSTPVSINTTAFPTWPDGVPIWSSSTTNNVTDRALAVRYGGVFVNASPKINRFICPLVRLGFSFS